MTRASLISVIIPVYNGDRYLADAIRSVHSQGDYPLEIIVIDDGSTDNSAEVARSFEAVRYAYQPNAGIAAARNHGVRLSSGGLLAFLDADDLWTPHKLRRQLAAFDSDPALDMVFGHAEQFVDEHCAAPASRRAPTSLMAAYVAGAMLIRRDAFLRVGEFNLKYTVGEFIDWFARATEAGLKARLLDELVLRRRIHDTNIGIRRRDARGDFLHLIKARLDRCRAQVT
jgi:glycosyltransferase involved in cell wall biosynthesis